MFSLNKHKIVPLVVLILISTSIFIYYLLQNYNVNYYDETGYITISQMILDKGLFSIDEPLRTYLYPLFITFARIFTNGNIDNAKITISILQFLLYIYTIFTVSSYFYRTTKNNLIYYVILTFGFLNPYLIQSTTLFLTDSLASCFIVLSVLHMIFNDYRKISSYFIVFLLSYAAVMVRPASAILIPIIFILFLYRKKMLNDLNLSKLILAAVISSIIFIPQLYNNVNQYNHWTVLVHQNLYEFQSKLAATYLKYGTLIIPNENPQLIFKTPFSVGSEANIFDLVVYNFPAFLVAYSSHIFGVLDWGYVDTYIRDFYPMSRILGSIFLYIFWILAAYGIVSFLKYRKKTKKTKFIAVSLLVSCLVYLLFIGTTVVESRFGYPVFLILLPFCGTGAYKMVKLVNNKGIELKRRSIIIGLYGVSFLIIIFVFFVLSFLLDYQTGRINWLSL